MQFAALGVPASASFLVFMFHDYLGVLVDDPAAVSYTHLTLPTT